MRNAFYILLVCAFMMTPLTSYSGEICSYKVKKGDWIAKILRDLGSKNPFSDKSYFKTVSLNKNKIDVNKLSEGERVLIPSFILSEELKSSLCSNKAKVLKSALTNTTDYVNKKQFRKPASTVVTEKIRKLQKNIELTDLEKKNKEELSAFEPFPILEYKAKLPAGGAK